MHLPGFVSSSTPWSVRLIWRESPGWRHRADQLYCLTIILTTATIRLVKVAVRMMDVIRALICNLLDHFFRSDFGHRLSSYPSDRLWVKGNQKIARENQYSWSWSESDPPAIWPLNLFSDPLSINPGLDELVWVDCGGVSWHLPSSLRYCYNF